MVAISGCAFKNSALTHELPPALPEARAFNALCTSSCVIGSGG